MIVLEHFVANIYTHDPRISFKTLLSVEPNNVER